MTESLPTNITYNGDAPQRLNKFLAQSGICSRREAEKWMADGRVQLNGVAVRAPGQAVQSGDVITIIEAIGAATPYAVLLHKPVGVVSAHPQGDEYPAHWLLVREGCLDIDAPELADENIPPAGRLDKESRGALILSRDGVLTKALIGADSQVPKTYEVEVLGLITHQRIAKLCFGLTLDGQKLRRADVTQIGPQHLRFVLREGRNRQIRRMCDKVGLKVVDLYRTHIGALDVRGMAECQWRFITPQERAELIG